jgi:hypothetical protein
LQKITNPHNLEALLSLYLRKLVHAGKIVAWRRPIRCAVPGGESMKSTLIVTLFLAAASASVMAQDSAAIAAAQSACGPKNTNFDAKEDASQHPTPQPEPGSALVYVVQDMGEEKCSGCALTRIGMDGSWVGANQGTSYFFFTAEPGEHHLCLNWQSRFEWRNKAFAMATFTAEAGHAYYFRSRISLSRTIYNFDFDPVNYDQGKFLVASSPLSVFHAKR